MVGSILFGISNRHVMNEHDWKFKVFAVVLVSENIKMYDQSVL